MPEYASENVFLTELWNILLTKVNLGQTQVNFNISLWLPCLTLQALVMGHYVCDKYEITFPNAF